MEKCSRRGPAACGQQPGSGTAPVALSELVTTGNPLAAQELTFDATFAREAIAFLRSPDPDVAAAMADSAAVTRILAHARSFSYEVPKDSREALVQSLLGPRDRQAERAAVCLQSLAYFTGPLLEDPR